MKTFLINPSRGIVIGVATKSADGWRFQPFTSAHQGSRKAHMTREAAALRYSAPSCRWLEAETAQEASKQVIALKLAYDAYQPCADCLHIRHTRQCARGAAPDFARNLGFCAKFERGIPCPRNPAHPLRQHEMQICVACESDMDAAIMHTISEPR
ncbi:MAG: hypothetical protein ACOYB3_01200 [Azonexus sp.]